MNAVTGYFGPAFVPQVNAGYALEGAEVVPAGAGEVEAEGGRVFVSEVNAVGTAPLALGVEGDAVCLTRDICAPLRVGVSATIYPVFSPAQAILGALYGEGFAHRVRLPAGFESGVTLTVVGVDGGAEATLFAVDGDGRIVATEPVTIAAGSYELTVEMTHGDLLGTLRLLVSAEIGRETPGADYVLSGLAPGAVAVAAGYVGAVYDVSLGAGAVSAAVRLPSVFDGGFTMTLSADSRGATVVLDSGLAAGAERDGVFELTVIRLLDGGAADPAYVPLSQILRVTVSALADEPVASLAGSATETTPYAASANVYDFRTALGGLYASANFGKESGAAELEVSAEGVVSVPADIVSPGTYAIVATATASAYLGTARLTFELEIFRARVDVSYSSVPADGGRGVLTAAGLTDEGDAALLGATVTFTATPAAHYYVSSWSHEHCATGDEDNTGAAHEIECEVVATTALSVSAEFSSRFPIRRGLELQGAPESGFCPDLEGGWRVPNFAEGLGLLADGETGLVRSRSFVLLPGVPATGAEIGLAPSGAGDVSAGTGAQRTSLESLQDGVLSGTAGIERDSFDGLLYARTSAEADGYCVRPLAGTGYVQPVDPAGVCLLPDCVGSAVIAAEAGARSTLTLFAWRLDSEGGTVTVGGDFGLDLLYRSGAAIDVETIGVFAGGALTVAVIPRAELADGAYAEFEAVPESGAAVGLQIGGALGAAREISDGDGIAAGAREATVFATPDYSGEVYRVGAGSGRLRLRRIRFRLGTRGFWRGVLSGVLWRLSCGIRLRRRGGRVRRRRCLR